MQNVKKNLFLFFYILSFVINAPPPIPEKMYEIVKDKPTLVKPSFNLFKRLDSSSPSMEIQNSTLVTNIYDDYRTEEHQLIIIAKNLPRGSFFQEWGFSLSNKNDFDDIEITCEILDSSETCKANKEKTKDAEYNSVKFSFNFKLFNDQQLIIKHSHKMKKSQKDILYKI